VLSVSLLRLAFDSRAPRLFQRRILGYLFSTRTFPSKPEFSSSSEPFHRRLDVPIFAPLNATGVVATLQAHSSCGSVVALSRGGLLISISLFTPPTTPAD
jgi:hypothetical protein